MKDPFLYENACGDRGCREESRTIKPPDRRKVKVKALVCASFNNGEVFGEALVNWNRDVAS